MDAVSLPVSAAQLEIWIAHQLDPDSPRYRIGEYLEIHGPVDTVVFERALRQVVGEAESLRVRFVETDGIVRQVVEPKLDWVFPQIDVSQEPDPHAAAETWMRSQLSDPMDPSATPLFSFALLKLGQDRFAWYQGYHHLVMDGFGFGLIARRLAQVYTAMLTGLPDGKSPFGSLRLLTDHDVRYRESEEFVDDRQYWTQRFIDRPEAPRLAGTPTDAPRTVSRRTGFLSGAAEARLRQLAQETGVRYSAVLVAAAAAYLYRMTGERDVIIGLPVAARPSRAMKTVPGAVSNMVPVRLLVHPDLRVSDLIRQASHEVSEAVRHQRYRGEDLARDLGTAHGPHDLFGLAINIMSLDYDFRFGEHRVTGHNLSLGLTRDAAIVVHYRANAVGTRIDFDANPELYQSDIVSAHHQRFLRVLNDIATSTDPGQRVGTVDVFESGEREQLLRGWNATASVVAPVTVPELFAAQVARTPDAVAVLFGDI
ncbi:MAG: non-ribosomal peptide synthetase, partial [Kutzneria sp.]|nr:non-ribosomal peptide synthetase [Kutzneria sp.]